MYTYSHVLGGACYVLGFTRFISLIYLFLYFRQKLWQKLTNIKVFFLILIYRWRGQKSLGVVSIQLIFLRTNVDYPGVLGVHTARGSMQKIVNCIFSGHVRKKCSLLLPFLTLPLISNKNLAIEETFFFGNKDIIFFLLILIIDE